MYSCIEITHIGLHTDGEGMLICRILRRRWEKITYPTQGSIKSSYMYPWALSPCPSFPCGQRLFLACQCLSVDILPPGSASNYMLSVVEDCAVLQIKVLWPDKFKTAWMLHFNFLSLEQWKRILEHHTKIRGFEIAMRTLVKSIEFPFHCAGNITIFSSDNTIFNASPLKHKESIIFIMHDGLKEPGDSHSVTGTGTMVYSNAHARALHNRKTIFHHGWKECGIVTLNLSCCKYYFNIITIS